MPEEERNKAFEIGHYQPTLLSSYGKGLGNTITTQALNKILASFKPEERYYIYRGLQMDQGDTNSALRTHLVNRMKQLFRNSVESDKDWQFRQLNDLARICLVLVKRGYPATGKLVDAVLITLFGDSIVDSMQIIERKLKCGKCSDLQSFAKSKKNGYVICCKCAAEIPEEDAKIVTRINEPDSSLVAKVRVELGQDNASVVKFEDILLTAIVEAQQFRSIDQDVINGLKRSIRKVGLLQPIGLRPLGNGTYSVVFGHHRFRACKELGWTSIKARILNHSELSATFTQIIENIHRNDEKNYAYLGKWFKEIMASQDWSELKIAEEIGKSQSWVHQCIRIAEKVPEELHEEIGKTIPRQVAYRFAELPTGKQKEIVKIAKVRKLPQRDLYSLIDRAFKREVEERYTCDRCHAYVLGSEVQAGRAVINKHGNATYYHHTNPSDCKFVTNLQVQFVGNEHPKVISVLKKAVRELKELGIETKLIDFTDSGVIVRKVGTATN